MAARSNEQDSLDDPISYITSNIECFVTLLEVTAEHNKVSIIERERERKKVDKTFLTDAGRASGLCLFIECLW